VEGAKGNGMEGSVQRDSLSVSPKPDHQTKVKKMLRELINDAEIVHVDMDRETFELNSMLGQSKIFASGTETLTVKYRRSEKAPKFNARQVKKDRCAVKKVLKKK